MFLFKYVSKSTLANFTVGLINGLVFFICARKIISLQLPLFQQRMFLTLGVLLDFLILVVIFYFIRRKWPSHK
jgi:hypothetical protein